MGSSLVKGKILLVLLVLLSFSAAGSLDLKSDWVASGDSLEVNVTNSSMNSDNSSAESFSVDVKSDSETGETVDVTETGADTGIFTGSITVNSSDSDGELLVSHGDNINASYDNGEDDSVDSAEADLEPPELVSAAVTSSQTVNVTLEDSSSGINKSSIGADDFGINAVYEVDSIDKSNVNDGSTSSQKVILNLNGTMDTGLTPSVNIKSADGIKDTVANVQDGGVGTSDEATPEVRSAAAVDNDADGNLDKITLTLSEEIEDYDSMGDAFDVTDANGSSIDEISAASGGASTEELISASNTVVIEIQEESTTGQPSIDYTSVVGGQIRDGNGNTLESASPTVTDDAEPVLLHAVVDKEKSSSSETYVKMKFSEPVEDSDSSSGSISIKQNDLDLSSGSLSKTYSVGYGSELETGDGPKISFNDNNIVDGLENSAIKYQNNDVKVETFRKKINGGWNFVSFPIERDDGYPIGDVFNESSLDSIWTYQGGEWLNYDPDADNNDFTEFKGGYGYLVRVNSGTNYVLTPNVNNTQSGSSSDASYEIEDGWNLVGHFQEYNQSADTSGAFSSLDSSVQSLEVQDTDGQLSTTTMSEDFLEPGEGYWVDYNSQDSYISSNVFSRPSQPRSLLKPVTQFVEWLLE